MKTKRVIFDQNGSGRSVRCQWKTLPKGDCRVATELPENRGDVGGKLVAVIFQLYFSGLGISDKFKSLEMFTLCSRWNDPTRR